MWHQRYNHWYHTTWLLPNPYNYSFLSLQILRTSEEIIMNKTRDFNIILSKKSASAWKYHKPMNQSMIRNPTQQVRESVKFN